MNSLLILLQNILQNYIKPNKNHTDLYVYSLHRNSTVLVLFHLIFFFRFLINVNIIKCSIVSAATINLLTSDTIHIFDIFLVLEIKIKGYMVEN